MAALSSATLTAPAFVAVAAIIIINLTQYAEGGERAPSLETFATYEDMQRYFANRNLRSLRFLENPTDDSYINAFNKHNEQPSGQRHQRSATQRKLPNEPTLVKFEISDAVEPSDEVKELIRQHRNRDLKTFGDFKRQTADIKNSTISTITVPGPGNLIKKKPKAGKPLKRTKRSIMRQPSNFQVKMIPFEATDAREPNEQTKQLIKRMRSLELKNMQAPTSTIPTTPPIPKFGEINSKRNYRRTRRSALQSQPQMIKFELEDAKEPDQAIKNLMIKSRESKDLMEISALSPKQNVNQTAADRSDMDISNDQSSHESKRYYVYKESPLKSKKSVNSLPHEVQHVISHLMKENHGGKAYVKYIPAQQMDYGRLKSYYSTKLATPLFGAKIQPSASYVKYVQPLQPKQSEQLVQVHSVPVVEKIRYIYTPVAATSIDEGGHGQAVQKHAHAYVPHNYVPAAAPESSSISHPIVVHETVAAGHASHQYQEQQQQQQHQQAAEVHHTYTADLTHVHHSSGEVEASAHAIKDIPAPHFRPSKPDPIVGVDDNKLVEGGGISEQYKYELYSHGSAAPQHGYVPSYAKQEVVAAAAPVIKIEYHAPPDALKENYKELHEFKELSALMGKSPEDQIHGLTYLLAKEMQSKLQLQRKQPEGETLLHQRPQDSTSPILFHPEDAHQQLLLRQPTAVAVDHTSLGVQKKFIGMAKTKQYIPIVEGGSSSGGASSSEQKSSSEELPKIVAVPVQHFAAKLEPQAPHPSSFIEYGLSPNYQGLKSQTQHKKVLLEQVIHHPTASHHHGLIGVGAHHGLHTGNTGEHTGASGDILKLSAQGLHQDDSQDLQYASKYAFGYRIRDFHTGNDFGHKQNRDLNGVTRGQYHILLPDGRIQNVIYHADDTGFHADVSFESGH